MLSSPLPRATPLGSEQRGGLRREPCQALGKGAQTFSVTLAYCIQAHVQIWELFIIFCYILSIKLFSLYFSRKSKFEL
jgi:hypothetical protein